MRTAMPGHASSAEPGLIPAGILALLVHVALLALMILGVSWKTDPPEGMVVDLWDNLPQPPRPPSVEPQPSPPRIEPPAKNSQPDVKPEVAAPKPDIAIKKQPEKEKPKKPVEKPAEIKPAEPDKQKARIAAEIAQLQREQQEAEKKLKYQREQAMAAQSRLTGEIDEYKAKILHKIRSRIVMPPDLPGNPVAEFDITLLPGGDVLNIRLKKSSGFTVFDEAVERAITLSRPLPLPADPALFPKFRNLSLKVHYRE